MTFKLQKTKQCKNCPWRVDSDPYAIPGYSPEMHQDLDSTIAEQGAINFGREIRAMACHDSPDNQQYHCIGWLDNQLGIGNNIGLRLMMSKCENAHEIKVFGDQYERFEDTLPDKDEECDPDVDWDTKP